MAAFAVALLIIMYSLLPFMKREPKPEPAKPPQTPSPSPPAEGGELEALRMRVALYKKIIERYREVIETSEDKSVTELRSLVNSDNPAIVSIRDSILEKFRPYLYDRDFPKAAELAYGYCLKELRNEFLPVDFWLTPEDILELKAADEMDKAIFLCSLLIALENQSAKVVVETEGRKRHAFVTFEFGSTFCLMDPAHGIYTAGPREKIISEQIHDAERKLIYEFNNKEYNEW